jgi:serine/threonine-protein kinase
MLGEGGMARVYRARQEHLDRTVAIKVLPPYYASDPAFVERFKLEARATAQLMHPNIVTVHDTGEERGLLYIVMEYIGGGTLKQHMRPPMAMKDVTRVIREVASALEYAHSKGIVHRDIKPVNVLMDTTGRAVLSDFGIAKILATSAVLTRSGAGVGTPEYMSPEQCRGATVDARTDIYALGVMLYEMLTGHTPFEADNYTALAHSHIYEAVPPPSRYNPRISPAVQAVILKALEKEPSQRFQNPTDMAATLEMAAAAQAPIRQTIARQATAGNAPAHRVQTAGLSVPCPACGRPNAPHQRFCSICGVSLATGKQPAAQQHPMPTSNWITCARCHNLNNPINRFCTFCGNNLLTGVSGTTCRICGTRNGAGIRFCTQCGSPLK